jgi:mannose-6-phosphate isomerase-like protein (cupin superfamily)
MDDVITTGRHYRERQQEVYFLHAGRIEMEFGDGATQTLKAGGIARVDRSTVRKIGNVSDGDAIYVVVGGADGYVGRDEQVPSEDEERYQATQ